MWSPMVEDPTYESSAAAGAALPRTRAASRPPSPETITVNRRWTRICACMTALAGDTDFFSSPLNGEPPFASAARVCCLFPEGSRTRTCSPLDLGLLSGVAARLGRDATLAAHTLGWCAHAGAPETIASAAAPRTRSSSGSSRANRAAAPSSRPSRPSASSCSHQRDGPGRPEHPEAAAQRMRRAHQRRRVRAGHGVPDRLEMPGRVREEDAEQLAQQLSVVPGVRERGGLVERRPSRRVQLGPTRRSAALRARARRSGGARLWCGAPPTSAPPPPAPRTSPAC